jgi:4a-hydroxytetrahydrobiopterin dehydratase
VATLLDDALVADSLTALEGWTGDRSRISRTVRLPAEQDARLRALVAETADAMDHHPVLEDDADGTRYVLWTHSEGGVTELDVALASRINDLLNRMTGDPSPSSAPRSDAPDVVAHAAREGSGAPSSTPSSGDRLEPLVGVAAVAQGSTPQVPVPDPEAGAPQPGVEPQQEPQQR